MSWLFDWFIYFINLLIEWVLALKRLSRKQTVYQMELIVLELDCFVIFLNENSSLVAPKLMSLNTFIKLSKMFRLYPGSTAC